MITPYSDGRAKAEQVRDMFNNIAPAYDRLNNAMSFGLDSRWRRIAVDTVVRSNPRRIIDIATGTGDFAISLAKAMPDVVVSGIDLSENMVAIGREKVKALGLDSRVSLDVDDCLDSKIQPESADAVTVAFGVRNFSDLMAGYRAMRRMLRPGGMICVLELSTPTSGFVRPFYNLYSRVIIPLMGRMVSSDRRAYSYLPESIAAVAQGRQMAEIMAEAGFKDIFIRRLTLGVCTLYTAINPG